MKILILGGTTEASALARLVAGDARFDATLSLAGLTRAPVGQPVPVRLGGFGGVDGLAAYLRTEAIEAVVDATHPFAAQISRHAAEAAVRTGVKRLAIVRPAWLPGPGDEWEMVPDMEAAAAALGPVPRRVLLTVGQKDLGPFTVRTHLYKVRSVETPTVLPAGATVITARGPFSEADERRLLRGIDVLVTKNSGGTATRAKLDAARALGVRVIMVERPEQPPGVPDAAAALAWLQATLRGE